MQLTAENLAADRSGEPVFSDISFSLDKGDGLIITGPNGAGKSTLLRVIAGLLPSLGGTLEFDGGDSWTDLADACHYLGHKNAMKDALSVRENLSFWQAFFGPPHMTIDDALDYVGLQSTADLPFGYLSTGQRRRISIAKLLISYRPVWLLDEPTAGLDADSERVVSHLLREHLDDGDIAIVATHLPLGLDGVKELKLELHQ